jgi:hypothetical protein
MDEVVRPHLAQPGGELAHQRARGGLGQRPHGAQELRHVAAGAELHDEVEPAVGLEHLNQVDNVGVSDALEDGHLALQALPQLGVEAGEVDLLDGHHLPRGPVVRLPHNGKGPAAHVGAKHPVAHDARRARRLHAAVECCC